MSKSRDVVEESAAPVVGVDALAVDEQPAVELPAGGVEATLPDGRVVPAGLLAHAQGVWLAADAVVHAGDVIVVDGVEHIATYVGHQLARWTNAVERVVVHTQT